MTENFEEPAAEQQDFARYLDIVRRRHIYFLIPLFLGWAIVWGSSWFLQARYRSSTLILVEQPTMPKNYVIPNVNDDLQERLQSIQQQILSRTRLLQIINNLNLYKSKPHHPLTPDDQVDRMRRDIGDIELIRDSQNEAITAFRVSYSSPDPHVAQQVTRELTNLFIDANLKVRQQESEDTTHFIEDRLAAARTSLAEQEAQIQDFQRAHEGELPSQQATNLQILSGLQGQLQNEQDALNAATQQRIYYQTLIDEYHTLEGPRNTGDGPTDLATLDDQLDKLNAQLAELSTHYTDQYPDVQKVKRQIARTEKLRDDLIASTKTPSKAGSQRSTSTAVQGATSATRSGPLLQLQSQLQANQAEIANREKAIAGLKARINDYQGRLNAEPASEQRLDELTRGYEQSKANYDDLLKKDNESQMATSMEEMQQGERFTILDPPSLPVKPDFPNRLKMCEAGFGVGLALGVLVVVALEFLDDRIHSEKQLRKLLPMAVISEIPAIVNPADEERFRRKAMLGWAMAAAVIFTILVGTAFSYLHA
jgi:polysaccharide biosynthesis transport protein